MESGRKKAEAEERKREKEGSAFEICVQKLFPPTLSARNSLAGFRSRGRNPRRHPNVRHVKKKYRIVFILLVCETFPI